MSCPAERQSLLRRISFVAVAILVSSHASVFAEAVSQTYIGERIPARISFGSRPIYTNSDSLILNGRVLVSGTDYAADHVNRQFILSSASFAADDTLEVRYTLFPLWVVTEYAAAIPVVSERYENYAALTPVLPRRSESTPLGSSLKISGSKSFRIASRTEGDRQFGQSLDLQISGSLTPGMQLEGSISDRGYDPSYGTSTSRLRELENVRLKLTTPLLSATVGDIEYNSSFDNGQRQESRLYGFSAGASQSRWNLNATAARARGRFVSKTTTGIDNVQGPYQITESNAVAIVPGSESVWLNGQELERGENLGYTVDYPTGRITFGNRYPIDRRSRIEVDYEVAETTYRPSLLAGGAGGSTSDSIFFAQIEWLREKDGESDLTGELSRSDRAILESAGDRQELAVRSGAHADTLGSYAIDSTHLPDTIFVFVGKGNGEYAVTFRYAGESKGSYRFLGGERYQYVGSQQGEYLPEVQLTAPEEQSYYSARVGAKHRALGTVTAELRQSSSDRNLLSSLDDGDNNGLFYQLGYANKWETFGKENRVELLARTREQRFVGRTRLYDADFRRRYLLPGGFAASSDERLYTLSGNVTTTSFLRVQPEFGYLSYGPEALAKRGGGSIVITPHHRIELSGGLVGTDLSSENKSGLDGTARSGFGMARYRIFGGLAVVPSWEFDDRTTTFHDTIHAIAYDQTALEIRSATESIRLERYREDTLQTSSEPTLTRDRLMISSQRRIDNFGYRTTITAQEVTEQDFSQRNLLADLDGNYNDVSHRLSVTTSYSLSHETRNARGITYYEVPRGQGTHRLENGQYIPDPDGDYIQVEEILSERASVSRGRKEFMLTKAWSQMNVRFQSHIEEELLPEGSRTALWALPFFSDETEPYLFYDRAYNTRIGLAPVRGVDVVTVQYADARQSRLLDNQHALKLDRNAQLLLKQPLQSVLVEERLEWFLNDHDLYYSGGGKYEGYELGAKARVLIDRNEYGAGVRTRHAQSATNLEATTFAAELSSRIRIFGQCEWSANSEFYLNQYSSSSLDVSYLLTDDRPGNRGAIWSTALRYRVRDEVRIDAGISGRHADDRPARLLVKGELLVTF